MRKRESKLERINERERREEDILTKEEREKTVSVII